jgi:hypothetical protein
VMYLKVRVIHRSGDIMAIKGQGTGTVLKKCKCPVPTRCGHGCTLRYWADGKQHEKTFRDAIGSDKKVRHGSGKQLAEDFQVKLVHGKRSGDVSMATFGPSWSLLLRGTGPFVRVLDGRHLPWPHSSPVCREWL